MSLVGAMRDRPYVFPFHNVILDPETGEVNGQNVLHMGQKSVLILTIILYNANVYYIMDV